MNLPLRSLILDFLTKRVPHVDFTAAIDHVNLIQDHLVDSMDFIDLLLFLEEKTGYHIDFMTIDMEHLMSIADIVAMFEHQLSAPSPHGSSEE